MKNYSHLYTLDGHKNGVITQISWSPDGKLLAAGFDAIDSVWIWDIETRELFYTLPGNGQFATSLMWMPNSLHLVVGYMDGTIRIWDVKKREIYNNSDAKAHSKAVCSLFLMDDTTLISIGFDGVMCSWSLKNKFERTKWFVSISAGSLTNKKEFVIARQEEVWYHATDRTVIEQKGRQSTIATYVACSFDGKKAVVGSEDGSIRLWDLEQERKRIIINEHKERIIYLQCFSDNKHFLSKSSDGSINIFNSRVEESIKPVFTYISQPAKEYNIGIAIHPIEPNVIALVKDTNVIEVCQIDLNKQDLVSERTQQAAPLMLTLTNYPEQKEQIRDENILSENSVILASDSEAISNKILDIKAKLTEQDLSVIQAVWEYFIDNYNNQDLEKRFISKLELYNKVKKFGITGDSLDNSIKSFSGSIIVRKSDGRANDPCYKLQFLGPFLTSDGYKLKNLIIACLKYLKERSTSANIAKAKLGQIKLNSGFSDEDGNLLKAFFNVNSLQNLISLEGEVVVFEADPIKLLETDNLESLFEECLPDYDVHMPIESLQQLAYVKPVEVTGFIGNASDYQENENLFAVSDTEVQATKSKKSILDNYEHIGLMGGGYFSIVKTYRHKRTKRLYAVKELTEECSKNQNYVRWFIREINTLRVLREHENIIELVDYEIDSGKYLYIMPKATTNLYDYIKSNNSKLGLEERLEIFEQILRAIKFAHSKSRLHRDIAPQNILLFNGLDSIPTVKVADFGIGKNLEVDTGLTHSNVAHYGHPYYVAPEQDDKLKNASFRSDIYSLGKLLNFVLTGRKPDTIHDCDFVALITKATKYMPNERHQNIGQFEEDYKKQWDALRSQNRIQTEEAKPIVRENKKEALNNVLKSSIISYSDQEFENYFEQILLDVTGTQFNVLIEKLRDNTVQVWENQIEETPIISQNKIKEIKENVFLPNLKNLVQVGLLVIKFSASEGMFNKVADLLIDIFNVSNLLFRHISEETKKFEPKTLGEHDTHTVPAVESILAAYLLMGFEFIRKKQFVYSKTFFPRIVACEYTSFNEKVEEFYLFFPYFYYHPNKYRELLILERYGDGGYIERLLGGREKINKAILLIDCFIDWHSFLGASALNGRKAGEIETVDYFKARFPHISVTFHPSYVYYPLSNITILLTEILNAINKNIHNFLALDSKLSNVIAGIDIERRKKLLGRFLLYMENEQAKESLQRGKAPFDVFWPKEIREIAKLADA